MAKIVKVCKRCGDLTEKEIYVKKCRTKKGTPYVARICKICHNYSRAAIKWRKNNKDKLRANARKSSRVNRDMKKLNEYLWRVLNRKRVSEYCVALRALKTGSRKKMRLYKLKYAKTPNN